MTGGGPIVGGSGYVVYVPGDLPVILGVPHDGTLTPATIADRTSGVLKRDQKTRALARAVADALLHLTGARPHVVACHLHRRKLDVNRPAERAFEQDVPGHSDAERAWREYHALVEAARADVSARFGRGLYVDVHGHAHLDQRVELGYLLRPPALALSDDELSQAEHVERSSVRALAERTPERLAAMLRGPESLGGTLERLGFPSVPSPACPRPGAAPYWVGGYSTGRHGSRGGGEISAVQLEANWLGVRDRVAARERFGRALAEALLVFFAAFVGIRLPRR